MTSPTPATVGMPRPLEPPSAVAALVFGVEVFGVEVFGVEAHRPDGFVVDWQLVAGDGVAPIPRTVGR